MNIQAANTAKLFQENPRCWITLDIQEYSSSQKLEISRNSKLFFPACYPTSPYIKSPLSESVTYASFGGGGSHICIFCQLYITRMTFVQATSSGF